MNRILLVLLIFISFSCTTKESAESSTSDTTDSKPGAVGQVSSVELIYETINPSEFSQLYNNTSEAILIDVRTPEEFRSGTIEGSKNMDFYHTEFIINISDLDKTKPYFLFCTVGGRSGSAASKMNEMGFEKVYNLEGGIRAWNEQGLAVVKP